jgi:predicted ATP-binding protein involved in virulence
MRQGCFLRGGLGHGTEAVVHIKTLSAQNFRCFKDLQISFQPGFNLLIGNNMSGKTAVLDALRSCLALSVSPLGGNEIPLAKNDFRLTLGLLGDSAQMQPNFPCSILCELQYGESMIEFIKKYENDLNPAYCLSGYKYSETDRGVDMQPVVGGGIFSNRLRTLLSFEDFQMPIVAYCGTNRVSENRTNVSKAIPELPRNQSRLFSYHSSLDDKSSLPSQRSWIERRTMSEVQRQLRKLPLLEAGPLLGIEKAILMCLPEIKQFYFDFEFQDLTVVFQDDRRLPWMMLSDGMRSVIALAMDIAWRAVVLNPQLGAKAPEQATGIVLIDELDLALHPVWQRRIVGDLSRAFPSIQFIATTHSPQIIGSAKNALVQQIDGDQVSAVNRPFGLDSNTVLTEIMGGEERDRAIVALFAEVNQLMNDNKWDEARQKLTAIGEQIDRQDTELVRLRARIDFLSRAASRN